MIHLLRRNYLVPDFKAENNVKRIIVTKQYNNIQSLRVTFDNLQPCVLSCDGYESLIGSESRFKTWHEFLAFISSEEKLYIFVDEDSMMKLFILWVKTIMPSMTATIAYRCYNTYVQRIKVQFPAMIMNASFLDYRKSQLLSYVLPNKASFTELFESMDIQMSETDRVEWVDLNKSDFSLEWHLANYEIDKSHISVFKQKYINILIKACAIEVSEWYQYITKYFMQPNVKEKLGISVSWDSEDWNAELKKCDKISWMFDDELLYVSKNIPYFLSNIDKALLVGTFLQDFWFKDLKIDDHIRLLDEDYFESNHAQFVFSSLKHISKNLDYLDDDTIHQIIKEEKQFEEISIIFDLLQHDSHKWNHYLVQYIHSIKDTNDILEFKIN